MGCVYHPEVDSVAYCDQCEAELCEGCTLRVEDGRAVCHRCMLALSLNDVKSEATMREQEEEDRRVGLQKKWRPTYIASVLAIGLVLVLSRALSLTVTKGLYLSFMVVTLPIGWTIGHTLMFLFYYGLLMPVGLFFRLVGRDPLHRKLDPQASTYWIPHNQAQGKKRYFHQF